MRVLVIGATGTIGSAVAAALAAGGHEVVPASRHGEIPVDIEDRASIEKLYESAGAIDSVVCAAGGGAFAPLAALSDDELAFSLRSKLMGQVNLVRSGLDRVRDGGAFVLTSGVLSVKPVPGTSALAMVNGALESFARAAALELPRNQRIHVVSPGWVKETLVLLGRDPASGIAAADLARSYLDAVEGRAESGETIHAS